MKRKTEKKNKLKRVLKDNPQVDEQIVVDSLEIISGLRRVGIKARGFNILRSSESRLKVKNPVVHHL
jgi:hypothetical protein